VKNLILLFVIVPVLTLGQTAGTKEIPAAEAKDHMGETATVCGRVADANMSRYAAGNYGWPISLALEKPEPHAPFVVGILSPKRLKPDEVKSAYVGKLVCATGKIELVRGVPQILATKPSQVEFRADAKK